MSQQLLMPFQSAHADSEDLERIKDLAQQMPFLEDPADPDWIFLPRSFLTDMPHRQPVFENNAVYPPTRCRSVPAPRCQDSIRQSIVSPPPAVPDAFNPEDCYPDQLNSLNPRYLIEPQPTLPTFNGKFGEWDAFWLQFQLLSDRYGWTGRKLADQLLLSLRDEALMFIASLPSSHRQTPVQLTRALQERFSHTAPTEAYRADLSNIQKNSTENLQEYASRVQALMTKAYPDVSNTTTYEELLIHHFMRGLPDQDFAYEVRVKQPKTLTEAVNYIQWHEYCTDATRRASLRHLRPDHYEETTCNPEISEEEVEPDTRSYVTEEQLQLLARDIKKINLSPPPEEDPDRSRLYNGSQINKEEVSTILPGYSNKEVAKLQEDDEDLHLVRQWLKEDMPDKKDISQLSPAVRKYWYNSNNIVCQDDVLYQTTSTTQGHSDYHILVPRALKICIIKRHHQPSTTEHLGVTKTSKKIREHFHWHQIEKDVRSYIRSCDRCSSKNQPTADQTAVPHRTDHGPSNQQTRELTLGRVGNHPDGRRVHSTHHDVRGKAR